MKRRYSVDMMLAAEFAKLGEDIPKQRRDNIKSIAVRTFTNPEPFVLEALAVAPYDGCFNDANWFYCDPLNNSIEPIYAADRHLARHITIGKSEKPIREVETLEEFVRHIVIRGEDNGCWRNWRAFSWATHSHANVPVWVYGAFFGFIDRSEDPDIVFHYMCSMCETAVGYHSGDLEEGENPYLYAHRGYGGVSFLAQKCACPACRRKHSCKVCSGFIEDGAPEYKDVLDDGVWCVQCVPQENCNICDELASKPTLLHGACPECVESLVEEFAKAKKALPEIEIAAIGRLYQICMTCGRSMDLPGRLRVDECEACSNKHMGVRP